MTVFRPRLLRQELSLGPARTPITADGSGLRQRLTSATHNGAVKPGRG